MFLLSFLSLSLSLLLLLFLSTSFSLSPIPCLSLQQRDPRGSEFYTSGQRSEDDIKQLLRLFRGRVDIKELAFVRSARSLCPRRSYFWLRLSERRVKLSARLERVLLNVENAASRSTRFSLARFVQLFLFHCPPLSQRACTQTSCCFTLDAVDVKMSSFVTLETRGWRFTLLFILV